MVTPRYKSSSARTPSSDSICHGVNQFALTYSPGLLRYLKFALTMFISENAVTLILPLGLAVLVSLLLVRGQSCGALTRAEPGDDLATLQAKAFANFRAECRANKRRQYDKPESK